MAEHCLGWHAEGPDTTNANHPTPARPPLYNLAPSALCTSGTAYPHETGLVRAAASGATKGDRCSSRSVQKTGCRLDVSCTGSGDATRAGPGRGRPGDEPDAPGARAGDGQDPGTTMLLRALSGSGSLPLGENNKTTRPSVSRAAGGLCGTASRETGPRRGMTGVAGA